MASSAKRGKESDPQCDSSGLKCICLSQSNTSDLPSTSKAAAVDRAINNQSDILGDEIFYVPCSKRTYKTISEISQNDFIVNDLFCLDKSATMSTLTAHCSKVIGRGGQNFPTKLEQKHYNSQ